MLFAMARPLRPWLLRFAAPAVLAAAAGGCSQLQLASAGPTACAPKEIEVRNVERSWKEESWEAVCKGVVYRCSQVATAWAVDVACTKVEASEPARDEAAPPAGASSEPEPAASESASGEADAPAKAPEADGGDTGEATPPAESAEGQDEDGADEGDGGAEAEGEDEPSAGGGSGTGP